jgi:hypothetical protein
MSHDYMPVHEETMEEAVKLLNEYTRLDNFRYCLRWSRCTVVGVFADLLQNMVRWLRTRSAWVYNVNLERHVCEYERRLERCFEQRSSMRGVLQETFEVLECVYDIFEVARAVCRLVKQMVRYNRHKAPSTYWASKHTEQASLPRLAFHALRR